MAHHALRLIASIAAGENRVALGPSTPSDLVRLLEVFQLTPELACEIASADLVFFLDADPSSEKAVLTPIEATSTHGSPIAHSMSAAEVVAMSRNLYAFTGEALLCHIPAKKFGFGEKLTAEAEVSAGAAAKMITDYIALHANANPPRLVKN